MWQFQLDRTCGGANQLSDLLSDLHVEWVGDGWPGRASRRARDSKLGRDFGREVGEVQRASRYDLVRALAPRYARVGKLEKGQSLVRGRGSGSRSRGGGGGGDASTIGARRVDGVDRWASLSPVAITVTRTLSW